MPIFAQSRRRFFKDAGFIRVLGTLPGGQRVAVAMAAKAARKSMRVYTRLGLRSIISASGTNTLLGESLMPEEVVDAMASAAKRYVPIQDLVKATGDNCKNGQTSESGPYHLLRVAKQPENEVTQQKKGGTTFREPTKPGRERGFNYATAPRLF